jgi:hypothetical protein
MNLRVPCPACQTKARLAAVRHEPWPCPACDFVLTPTPGPAPALGAPLAACQHCGHADLYVQKDFPHAIGVSVLIGAVIIASVAYGFHMIWLTWAVLIGSAIIDTILDQIVGNVTVCYRCQAEHRGAPTNADHRPFDLAVGEKYRQERLRNRPELARAENGAR